MINGKSNFLKDALRGAFCAIDWILFLIFGFVYEIFFDISMLEFISGETVYHFFKRVQLILGVFMVFKLTVSILRAIVDPEKITDKNNGFSSIIMRVVTCLVMLTMLIPINVQNPKTEYEMQINNNGLLFGTLYSLQWRILENNTLGKLVLGTDNVSDTEDNAEAQVQKMKDTGAVFTTTILKGFMQYNQSACGSERKIGSISYDSDDLKISDLTDNINTKCNNGEYALIYYPIISGIVAIMFTVVLVGFCVDIAVRAIKLAVLRLIAPIPIISYMDPNQEKKGAFGNWVKVLTVTYLDLFLRLAIIYFVIFLIQDIQNLFVFNSQGDNLFQTVLAFVLICWGLFVFAKQAVPFITQVLGLQGMMQNVGLASILSGNAMAGGGFANGWRGAKNEGGGFGRRLLGGLTGAAAAFSTGAMMGSDAAIQAAREGKSASLGQIRNKSQDLMAQIRTGDKDAHGGIGGRVQDYLSFRNRENSARALGIGARDFARASYKEEYYRNAKQKADHDLRDATLEQNRAATLLQDARASLSTFGNGGAKYTKSAFLAQHGFAANSVEGENAYASYSKQYDAAYSRVQQAQQNVQAITAKVDDAQKFADHLEVEYGKASRDKERMDKERQAMHVEPRIGDVERYHIGDAHREAAAERAATGQSDKFRDSAFVNAVYDSLGRVSDAVHYREPYSVVKNDDGTAVNVSDPTRDTKTKDYTYARDRKSYTGSIDETTFLGMQPSGSPGVPHGPVGGVVPPQGPPGGHDGPPPEGH